MVTTHSPANRKRRYVNQPTQHRDGHNQLERKFATLNVELYLDDTSSAGIISALWDAANSAPDTSLAFSFDVNGDTFTGNVFPVFPTVGGAATDVLSTSLSFVVEDGTVARA